MGWIGSYNSAPGSLNRVPTCSGKGRNITSVGWQVTLRDPIWRVSSRSRVVTLRTAIPSLLTAGPAESNGKLLLGTWHDSLHVTCGLTACTPGSAPGPTLGNEYGKTLPLLFTNLLTYFNVAACSCRLRLCHVIKPNKHDSSTVTAMIIFLQLYWYRLSCIKRSIDLRAQKGERLDTEQFHTL